MKSSWPIIVLFFAASVAAQGHAGSAADRRALADDLIQKTMEREAFSHVKNQLLGLEVHDAMRSVRDEIVAADNDESLFYALRKLSAARRDRHLKVRTVDGGLQPFRKFEQKWGRDWDSLRAPIQLTAGFPQPENPEVFVTNKAADSSTRRIAVGDKIIAINGTTIDQVAIAAKCYLPSSTDANFWMRWAKILPELNATFPPQHYRRNLNLKLQGPDGHPYEVKLPYLESDELRWLRCDVPRYAGFERITFDLSFEVFAPTDDRKVLVLYWYGFRKDLKPAIDRLMTLATERGWLDYDLIIDCLNSRGGSLGAYAIQHFSAQPFRTTHGNIRLSDIADPLVDDLLEAIREDGPRDGGNPEVVDDGTWLKDWIETEVKPAMANGDAYTRNVPFKCAHLPHTSDGTLQPGKVHFRGKMICWFGPYGGSHLDQFAAMIRDNRLAWTIGMPTGGYSNTWEWEEVVKFPTTGKAVAKFMWSAGHTIRPNGEVLEGNPANVDEYFPMTARNYLEYRQRLLARSLEKLNAWDGDSVSRDR